MGKVSRSVHVAHVPLTIVVPPVTPPVLALPKGRTNTQEIFTLPPSQFHPSKLIHT